MKRFFLALVPLVFGACEGGTAETDRPVTLEVDSAGVTIIRSSAPYPTWSLGAAPVARIGVVSGDPDHQLSDVAYAGRLKDGRIVLFDQGSSEVRWYDADGTFRSRVGGRGQGPGEFSRVVSAALTAEDTLVLYDSRNQRLTWVGPDGSIARTRRMELGSSSTVGLVPLEEGRVMVAEERATFNFGESAFNYARDSLLVMVTSGASAAVDTILRLPGREAVTWVDYVDGRPMGTRQMSLPLGQRTLIGALSDTPVLIGPGRSDLAFLDPGGDPTRLARRSDVDPPPVPDSLRARFVTEAVERGTTMGMDEAVVRAASEDRMGLLPEDRRIPPFDLALTNAARDRLWVRDFLPEWREEDAREWTVHDSTGRVIARVTTPPGLEITQVGGGYVVGVARDEMGVEYVLVYALATARAEEVVVLAAQRLMEELPADAPPLMLWPHWGFGRDESTRLPAGLLDDLEEATGLDVATVHGVDSTSVLTLMTFHRVTEHDHGTLRVLADLTFLEGAGEPGWGREFQMYFDCSDRCVFTKQHEGGWN